MKPGDLVSAKGPGIEHTLDNKYYGVKAIEELKEQTRKYVRAAAVRGASVKLYFAEEGAARIAKKAFRGDLADVKVSVLPPSKQP